MQSGQSRHCQRPGRRSHVFSDYHGGKFQPGHEYQFSSPHHKRDITQNSDPSWYSMRSGIVSEPQKRGVPGSSGMQQEKGVGGQGGEGRQRRHQRDVPASYSGPAWFLLKTNYMVLVVLV